MACDALAAATAIIRIQVEAGGHTGYWEKQANIPDGAQTFNWSLPTGSDLDIVSSTDENVVLATLDSTSISVDFDPFVALNFAVFAGPVPTNFTISSALVPFAPINNGLAFATAGVTVTETPVPSFDGASLTGLYAGAKAYQARYNGGGSVFANLISPVIVAPLDITGSMVEKFPPGVGTRVVIPGLVSDIESEFSFTLSANDQASGTSIFDIIVPEPSSVAMAGIGLLAIVWQIWRRRRLA
jgi:hypothetical protein